MRPIYSVGSKTIPEIENFTSKQHNLKIRTICQKKETNDRIAKIEEISCLIKTTHKWLNQDKINCDAVFFFDSL